MEQIDLIFKIYDNLSDMIIGLIVFSLFLFVCIVSLFVFIAKLETKINYLEFELDQKEKLISRIKNYCDKAIKEHNK